MPILQYLQAFFADLREQGIPVTTSQVRDCCQAVLLIDWMNRDYFYATLFATLVKDYSYQKAFDLVFNRFFEEYLAPENRQHFQTLQAGQPSRPREETAVSDFDIGMGTPMGKGGTSQTPGGKKNPLEQDFGRVSIEELAAIEAMVPLLARRLAAKFVKKRKRNDQNRLDFRRTIRSSLSTGGIPLNLFTIRKYREKPVILILCDVSGSVMNFSCIALALIASLERFFQHIESYAFIDEIADITGLLLSGNPLNFRAHVLRNARVVGVTGYTNYGHTLEEFRQRYRQRINRKTSVLIFGDARNNWQEHGQAVLKEIRGQAKKVYWFNPEPRPLWNTGDSIIYDYAPYCDKVFACPTLGELEKSLAQI
ncbi:MAG: VWA domain-containing protein [Syntrophomonadaceae bacterium]